MFARGQIVDSSCRFACPRPSHANNSSNARVPLTYASLLSAQLQQHNLNRLQEHLIGVRALTKLLHVGMDEVYGMKKRKVPN